jgi:hypothetical protein
LRTFEGEVGRGTKERSRSIGPARVGSRRRGLPPIQERALDYLLDPESEVRERWARINSLGLSPGKHSSIREGCNVMEAASYLAGRPWSSTPSCVAPIITVFLQRWNDDLTSDELRNRLLKPLIPAIIGTSRDPCHEEVRSWMCVDWIVREYAPAFLRLAGLEELARQIEALSSITADKEPSEAEPLLRAVRRTALEIADDQIEPVVWGAIWNELWVAAGNAAWPAATIAAWPFAASSPWIRVAKIAWGSSRMLITRTAESNDTSASAAFPNANARALQETVERLQASAVELVQRMAAVERHG